MKSIGIGYRQRVFGRSDADADQPEAATVLGRLAQDGFLWPHKSSDRRRQNDLLREAGEFYLKTRTAAQKAMLVKPIASAGNLERAGGFDGSDGADPDYVERCRRAIQVNDDLRNAIYVRAGWQAVYAVDLTVWSDFSPREPDHLRNGLKAIRSFMDAS